MPQARRSTGRTPVRGPRQHSENDGAENDAAERHRPDLFGRVIVAVPAATFAVLFAAAGGTTWAVLMAALGCVCIHELYRMLDRWHPAPVVGYLAVLGMCATARFGGERDTFAVALATVPLMLVVIASRPHARGMTVAMAGTMLGVFWIAMAFAHAVLLMQLPHGNGIVIDVMVGTFLADTGAYFGGRLWGRHPLAPEISPNKTVEGLVCGMLTAIVAVFCAHVFQDTWLSQGQALIIGVTVAVLGPIGDLFESAIKRDSGTKDAGSLFGAHGGALDRLDAISFTIVAAYYVWAAAAHF